jgi:hypothetical protein
MSSKPFKKSSKRKRKTKPFTLSPCLQTILEHWRNLDSLPPKVAAVVETCSLSEVYDRLYAGEYTALKDGASTKILTSSILARREKLPPAQFGATKLQPAVA